MKTIMRFSLVVCLLLGCNCLGQIYVPPPNSGIISVGTAPSGSCRQGAAGQMVTTTGAIWTCQNIVAGIGTWTATGGGGGSGNVTGPSSAVANDSAGFADGTGKVLQDTGVYEAGGVVEGSLLDNGGAVHNVKYYAAVSDGIRDLTCSTDGTTANLTCTDAPFSACPTGKVVSVNNAGASNGVGGWLQLITTIASCSSSTVAVMATASSHASGTVQAIWGTDNFPSFQTAIAAAAGGELYIPGQVKFLVNLPAGTHITVPSNTSVIGDLSNIIYMVGVPGTPSGDVTKFLFNIADPTSNVIISGLHIMGENYPYYSPGGNQSEVVFGLGISATSISSIHTNFNLIENLYGFGFHNNETSYSWDMIGNTFNNVANGENLNSNYSQQNFNHINGGGGIETSGDHSSVSFNTLSPTSGQYAIQTGGRTGANNPCAQFTAVGNIIVMSSTMAGGFSVGDCTQHSEFADNTMSGFTGTQIPFALVTEGFNDISWNNIHDNHAYGTAAEFIYTAGVGSPGTHDNFFHDNDGCNLTAAYGEIFTGAGPETSSNNCLAGTSFDLITTEPNITSTNDQLNGTGTTSISGAGSFTARSLFSTASGQNIPTGSTYQINNVPLVALNQKVPGWAQYLGDGSGGAATCSGNLSGEYWFTTFTVATSTTCTVNNPIGLVIHATGACTIAGSICANGSCQAGNGTPVGGAAGGGSGGGAAAGTAGTSLSLNGINYAGGGSAGAISGGNGGNGYAPSTQTQHSFTSVPATQFGWGGGSGRPGGSSGGTAGVGGAGVFLICNSIVGTGGTIDVSGTNGGNAPGSSTGAGSGGGGGVIIISAHTHTNDPTLTVTGGAGGTCGAFTVCGTGGNGGNGWSKSLTF